LITKIIDGPPKPRLKTDTLTSWFLINHRMDGFWEVYSRVDTNENWTLEGSIFDKTFYHSTYTGISIKHTSTRSDKLIFDNLNITPLEIDTIAPICTHLEFMNDSSVQIYFSEEIDTSILRNISFSLDGNNLAKQKFILQNRLDIIYLVFEKNITEGEHQLIIPRISDILGNISPTLQIIKGTYIPPILDLKYDIIISEMMADPSPAVDLPEAEYIELYNTSSHGINLEDWEYHNGNTKVNLPKFLLNPKSFVILCKNTDTTAFKAYGDVIGLTTWPSVVNSGGRIIIKNKKGEIIDQVEYQLSWYKNKTKESGGYSLEYNKDHKVCEGFYLWEGSESAEGGTPGRDNFKWGKVEEEFYVKQIRMINDTSIYIQFSDIPDTSNLRILKNFNLKNLNNPLKQINYVYNNLNEVILTFSTKFLGKKRYELQISNINTCANVKLQENIYILNYTNNDDTSKIRINELYVDPYPSNGLPEAEYIEIFNASPNIIQLNGYSLNIGTTKYYLPAQTFLPNEYIILCSSNDTTELKKYGRCIGISGWINLSNTNSTIIINNKVGRTIDRVSYRNTWYRDNTKTDGGWSLELIDPYNRCDFINKWSSSKNIKGGTPGSINSIADFHIDLRNLSVASFQNINGMQFKIKMNKAVDGRLINPAQLYFVGAKSKLFFPQKMEIDSPYYQIFTLTFNTALPNGKYNLICQYIPSCSRADTNVVLPVTISSVVNSIENIRISELMTDPSPSRGLPEVEYIELFNKGNESIENITIYIADTKDTIPITIEHWVPNKYIVLCHKEFRNAWDTSITIIPLNKTISLSNETDTISLLDENKIKFEEFSYSYLQLPIEKREGGYSFSRINNTWDCGSNFVWQASSNTLGGSPGKENEDIENYTLPPISIDHYEQISDQVIRCIVNPKLESNAIVSITDINQSELSYMITKTGELYIYLKNALRTGTTQEVHLIINNCLGMKMDTSIVFYQKHIPQNGEMLINEILFNPSPGGVDFIELYNNSDSVIDIKDLFLSDDKNNYSVKSILKSSATNTLIQPKEYRVISINSDALKAQFYIKHPLHLLECSKLISMPDDHGIISLLNENNEVVDRLEYDETFHLKWLKETEGRSLERKRFNKETNSSDNWSSATDDIGLASPTYNNSQHIERDKLDRASFWLSKEVLNPIRNQTEKQIEIHFNSSEETRMVNVKVFTSAGLYLGEIIKGRSIRNDGILVWDLNMEGQLLANGTYILGIESYTETGVYQYYKIPFVLRY